MSPDDQTNLCHFWACFLLPFYTSATFVRLIQHFSYFTSESGSFLAPVSPVDEISVDFLVFWLETARRNVF